MIPYPRKGNWIDLHTHRQEIPDGEFALVNLFAQDTGTIPEASNRAFTVGLHPWHLEQINLKKQIGKLADLARQPGVVAVGEAGLDRAVEVDFSLQKKLYHIQLDLAEETGKPLLVHCVKAYSDFLQMLKERRPGVPTIVHGFRGSDDIANRLIEKEVWLSFGWYLTHPASRQAASFRSLPPDKLFLESDVSDFPIADLYRRAAGLKGWSPEKWAEQIYDNYNACFNPAK